MDNARDNYDSPWFPRKNVNWEKLFTNSTKKTVKKDTIVIHQDTTVNQTFYIKSGRVKFSVLNSSGEEKTILVLNSGNIFCDIPAVTGCPYLMNATADTDCVLYCLESNKFIERILTSRSYVMEWISSLSATTEYLINHIRDITFLDSHKLISKYLYKLGTDYGIETPMGTKLNITFTHQEMAYLVGTSRVTVTKIMNSLVREEAIRKVNGRIYITDMDKLQHYIG